MASVQIAASRVDPGKRRSRRDWAGWILLGPALLYLAVFAIFPLFYSLRLSFTDARDTDAGQWVGLANYAELLADPDFWEAARVSAVMVSVAVISQVVLGTALAIYFNRELKGAWIVRGILVLPMLILPIIVGVMWRALLNPDWGLINWALARIGIVDINWLGSPNVAIWTLILVDIWQWTPFVFIIVYARLQALPQDVFEAAAVDGARPSSIFRSITLPMLMPAIAFAAIFRAVDAFRNFDLIYGLTYGGPDRSTTTLAWFSFQNGFQFSNYGYAAAVAYVMVIILIVGTTFLLRFINLRVLDSR